ncbi:hypothetical protein [Actinopolyspora alba]|uniref:hypothetical protein n=1 Tax=Actinopolyspora alba TaxID=673379 RepID=UPI001587BF2C|nr:hypothetical protein [Actinopolyspora alba]
MNHGGPERRCVTGTNRVTGTNDTAAPDAPPRSRCPEEPAGGLCEFGLGMIPASITPPRTWRRAAWFVVVSAAAALGGIVLVTAVVMSNEPARLATSPRDLPRAGEYPPLYRSDENPAGSGVASTADDNGAPEPSFPRVSRQPTATGRTGDGVPPVHDPLAGTPQRSSTAAPSASWQSTAPTREPPAGDTSGEDLAGESTSQGTTPVSAAPVSDDPSGIASAGTLQQSATPWHTTASAPAERPTQQSPTQQGATQQGTTQQGTTQQHPIQQEQGTTMPSSVMLDLTERYFRTLDSGEPYLAHGLTAGSPHRTGLTGLRRRYAELGSVELVNSTVRGDGTVNELRVNPGGGEPTTRYRRLEFDEHPRRVISDEPVDDPPGNR